jgi:hypothetical protein
MIDNSESILKIQIEIFILEIIYQACLSKENSDKNSLQELDKYLSSLKNIVISSGEIYS